MGQGALGGDEPARGRSPKATRTAEVSCGVGPCCRRRLVFCRAALRRNREVTSRVRALAIRRGDDCRNWGDVTQRRDVLFGYSRQQDRDGLHQTRSSAGWQTHQRVGTAPTERAAQSARWQNQRACPVSVFLSRETSLFHPKLCGG